MTWWALLRYYRRLNRAKFVVINEMEAALPAQPYTREWAELHPGAVTGGSWWARFSRQNRHREASMVEQVVPFVFAAIYVVLALRTVTQ